MHVGTHFRSIFDVILEYFGYRGWVFDRKKAVKDAIKQIIDFGRDVGTENGENGFRLS
jgi:hypothetical protein